MLRQLLFQDGPMPIVQRAYERLARIERGSPQGILGKVKGK